MAQQSYSYYAVAVGRVPGIYHTWADAKTNVDNFKGARYKKFLNKDDALSFMKGQGASKKIVQAPQANHIVHTAKPSLQTSILDFVQVVEPKENEKTLIVFTDGACIHNGKPNAKASFACVWPEHPDMDFGTKLDAHDMHTNNRGEYSALVHAFHQADALDPEKDKTLIVYTDSQLMINSLTLWLSAWKRRDWKKADGERVANIDLLKKLDDDMKSRKTVFRHVRAHTGANTWEARYNDKVDRLAQAQLTM
jgi:ribonuclease HI